MPGTRLEDATAIFERMRTSFAAMEHPATGSFERMRTSFAAMEHPATGSLDVPFIAALDATLQTSLAS